jgi:3-oxoacyl-[acyl-carrier protein] reductase
LIEKVQDFKIGARAIAVRANIRIPSCADLIVGKIADFGGLELDTGKHKVDILVNNAGVELAKYLGSITPEDFESLYNLNVRGTL